MRARPDRSFAVGVIGASAVLALLVLVCSVPDEAFDAGPYGEFVDVFERLGYRFEPAVPGSLEAGKHVILALGDYLPREEGALRAPSGEELIAFAKSGGTVLAAGNCDLPGSGYGHPRPLLVPGLMTFSGPAARDVRPDTMVAFSVLDGIEGSDGAEVIARAPDGPCVIAVRMGTGSVYRFADDALFRGPSMRAAEGAVFLNALLSPEWGKTVLVAGRSVPIGQSLSSMRLLAFPGAAVIASLSAVLLAALAWRYAVSTRGRQARLPVDSRSIGTHVGAIGAFYLKNAAFSAADGFLAARFSCLVRISAPGAASMAEAARRLAGSGAGLDAAGVEALATREADVDAREFRRRREARAAMESRLRENWGRKT